LDYPIRQSLYLRFARLIVVNLLQNHPLAKISLPSNEKVAEYKLAIAAKYPLLQNVYCVADGLKISIQAAGQQHVQQQFYNGWQRYHCISNVFVLRQMLPSLLLPETYQGVCMIQRLPNAVSFTES
jgi:hypothetical protein